MTGFRRYNLNSFTISLAFLTRLSSSQLKNPDDSLHKTWSGSQNFLAIICT